MDSVLPERYPAAHCTLGVSTVKGDRDVQQDEVIAIQDIFNNGGSHALCGVFDGHGVEGHRVAAFVKRRLPMEVSRRFADFESDPIQAFTRVFASTNAALRARRSSVSLSAITTTVSIDIRSPTDVILSSNGNGSSNNHSGASSSQSGNSPTILNSDDESGSSSSSNGSGNLGRNTGAHLFRGPIDIYMSGTTATVALISATQVLVANLGDSRAILIQRPTQLTESPGNSGADNVTIDTTPTLRPTNPTQPQLIATQITTDHTCECEPERARVEQSGARVDYQREPSRSLPTPSAHTIDGPLRIYNGSLPYPGLVVTRAFGDSSALRLGVISEPEVRCYTLNPARDVGLVLATDGVWDVLQNQHVAHIYSSHPGNMAKVSKLITKVSLKMQQRAQLADNTTVVAAAFSFPTATPQHQQPRQVFASVLPPQHQPQPHLPSTPAQSASSSLLNNDAVTLQQSLAQASLRSSSP